MLQSSPAAIHRHNVPSTSIPSLSFPDHFPCSLSSPSSLPSLSVLSRSEQRFPSFSCNIQAPFRSNRPKDKGLKVMCSQREPLKVMISGAPASGKGTQCEMIVQKFGLVHISTGDLLRAEVSAGSIIGNKAKEYMNAGRLVPDEVVTAMVIARLSKSDAKEKGWLLDGYPRSYAQAQSLEEMKIRPDVYIMLEVPVEILIDRCIGRRLDPETGKIYHIKNFPPETDEVKARLVTRPDDTEDKVKSRLQIYRQNADAILSTYMDILHKIDGNRPKQVVFEEIDSLLSQVQKDKVKGTQITQNVPNNSSSSKESWRGIPTRLNNIPHSREIREYFYSDVLQATQRAINDGKIRLKVEINIPELNPEMDVYRIGTLMELVRVLALSFADDGKRVKVCVQGSMGEGALAGMPLQLAGTRKILEFMDWGNYGAMGTFINIGSIGAQEVSEQDNMFILVAPQNIVGCCIIDDLKAMTDAAGNRPVIVINPKLKISIPSGLSKCTLRLRRRVESHIDIGLPISVRSEEDLPSSSGIMQTMGREKRMEYAASFEICYIFRLLYYAGTQYPIMGALRMSYPYGYELYKRVDESPGKEKYIKLTTFPERPNVDEINDAFSGKPRNRAKETSGFWGFLSGIFE